MKKITKLIISGLTLLALLVGFSAVSTQANAAVTSPTVTYDAHVQNIGWQPWASNGALAGTTGKSLRMEALKIELQLPTGMSGGITYDAHVQNIGWQPWVSNGAMAGTTGKSLRMEALEIKLTGAIASRYDVVYRAHVQNIGWQGWVSDGALAGTTGKSLRMEALEIELVPKSTMNLSQIKTGNYASIDGNWKDAYGDTLSVSGNTIKWTDTMQGTGKITNSTITGLTITSTGYFAISNKTFYVSSNSTTLYFTVPLTDSACFLNFYPKGVAIPNVTSDTSQDRIIASITNGLNTSNQVMYYNG